MTIYKGFAAQYTDLLQGLLDPSAFRETNERTGVGVSFMPQGWSLTVNVGRGLPLINLRKTYPRTAAAEVEWFVSGERSLDILHRHSVHMWDDFAYRTTRPPGMAVGTAYGYRWRKHFGRDQLREAVSTLIEDPTSRRVVVTAWDPSEDGMRSTQVATPCPFGFSLSTSRMPPNKPRPQDSHPVDAMRYATESSRRMLNSSLWIRSSDVFVGLPYDVMGHAVLMGILAAELGMQPGWLHVSLAHPHLYDVHREMAREGLEHITLRRMMAPHIVVPHVTLSEVEEMPGILVATYETAQSLTDWPLFNPRPEVVK